MAKPNVIAELAVNWSSIDKACEMIRQAKAAGADYVKFQLYDKITVLGSPYEKELMAKRLNETQLEALSNCAKANKIGFILTPMYLDAVEIAERYADMIKIRYADHDNEKLIEKALDTHKTLLISAPCKPVGRPDLMYSFQIKWMYCIPRYPPEPSDFNLDLASSCQGFSSHFPYTVFDIAYAAVRCYEDYYIEKHLHPNGVAEYMGMVESEQKVSISFDELAELVRNLQLLEKMRRRPRI